MVAHHKSEANNGHCPERWQFLKFMYGVFYPELNEMFKQTSPQDSAGALVKEEDINSGQGSRLIVVFAYSDVV